MSAAKRKRHGRICLTMMIKDEAPIIKRCLDSVVDHIDYWVVCDTGSTDGTQALVQEYFDDKDIPGELHQHQWKNFGHNRSLALKTARGKCDYIMIADADQTFEFQTKDFAKNLNQVGYYCFNYCGNLRYMLPVLIDGTQQWHYVGVTHEYLDCKTRRNYLYDMGTLDNIIVYEGHDGDNHSVKYEKDIALLKQGLKDEPKNSRYRFYLARSYEDTLQYEKAIKHYELRIAAGEWAEEVYYSMYGITRSLIQLRRPFSEIINAALRAFEYRPWRIEAMFEVVRYCREHNHCETGFLLGKALLDAPFPSQDKLFIHNEVYEWAMKDEVAVCAYQIGKFEWAERLNQELLNSGHLPEEHVGRISANLEWSRKKLSEAA